MRRTAAARRGCPGRAGAGSGQVPAAHSQPARAPRQPQHGRRAALCAPPPPSQTSAPPPPSPLSRPPQVRWCAAPHSCAHSPCSATVCTKQARHGAPHRACVKRLRPRPAHGAWVKRLSACWRAMRTCRFSSSSRSRHSAASAFKLCTYTPRCPEAKSVRPSRSVEGVTDFE